MNPNFEKILDECISAMKNGSTLEACLEKYPEHAEELHGFLTTVSMIKAMPKAEVSLAVRRESERRMLETFHNKELEKPVSKSIFTRYTQRRPVDQQPDVVRKERVKMKNKFSYLIAGLVLTIIIATTGVTVASANALPGETLYPVKNSLQQVRMFLTFSEEGRAELEEEFHQELIEDVMAVMDDGSDVDVEFTGIIEEISDDYIVVDGVKVMFDENTKMPEYLEIGMLVEVEGHVMEDGSLLAYSVAFENDDDSSDDEYDDDDSSDDEYDDDDSSDDEYDDDDDSSDDEYDDDDDSSDDEYDDDGDDSSDDEYDDDGDDSSDDEDEDSSDDEYDDEDDDDEDSSSDESDS